MTDYFDEYDREDAINDLLHAAKTGDLTTIHQILNAHNPDFGKGMLTAALEESLDSSMIGDLKTFKILIHMGADVNARAENGGHTALYFAIENNDHSMIEYLLSHQANNLETIIDSMTYLHQAVRLNQVDSKSDLIQTLLKNGADVNAHDCYGNTPLFTLVDRSISIKLLKLLLDFKADVNIKNNKGKTPVFEAVLSERIDVTRLLIDHGSDIKVVTIDNGFTPLHETCKKSNRFEMAELLLNNGADANVQDNNGNTALYYLLQKVCKVEALQLFSNFSADLKIKNNRGENLLFSAVRGINAEVIKLLIDLGLDINCVTKDGSTPLHTAAKFNDKVNHESQLRIVEMLLKCGANVNLKNHQGEIPLFNAVRAGKVELVKLLLDYGSDIKSLSLNGSTLLHAAATLNFDGSHLNTIQMLLSNGADINAQDQDGNTLLHYLARQKNLEIVKSLIKLEANVKILNKLDENALIQAVYGDNLEIVQLLIDHGAVVNCIDKRGLTPLLVACEKKCKIEIFKTLLKSGAQVDVFDGHVGQELLLTYMKQNCFIRSALKFFFKYLDINLLGLKEFEDKFFLMNKKIIEHNAKLKILELPVNSDFLRIVSIKKSYHKNYFDECLAELTVAKGTKLKNSWVTFFNLLVDSERMLKNYAGNEDLIEDFKNTNCKNKFPIYGAEMEKNVEEGIKKRKFYDKSIVELSNCLPTLNPTHLVIRDILDCVSTKGLYIFCENSKLI